jgi:hypothetical protein
MGRVRMSMSRRRGEEMGRVSRSRRRGKKW